jgi:hypothetical protein
MAIMARLGKSKTWKRGASEKAKTGLASANGLLTPKSQKPFFKPQFC